MTAAQLPFFARLGLHVGVIGSLASLAVGVGTAVDAAARIGLYAVTTAGSEQLGIGVGGIQGPTFTRNGSAVDTTLPGDVVISGNLTVSGTTTTINSTVVNVQDKVLSVAYTAGANVAVPAVIAGITVYRGAIASVARDSAGLFWDENASAWKFALNTGNDNSTLGAAQAVVMAGLTATTGAFTTISASGQITSTVSTGSAPLVVASTTVVGNLNVSALLGATWAAPGTIGSGTPSTGAFTTVTTSVAGSSSSLSLGIGTAIAAAARIGFYADTSVGTEALASMVGGVAGLSQQVSSGAVVLSCSAGVDTVHTFGYACVGFLASASAGDALLYPRGGAITGPYFRARANGSSVINAATAGSVAMRINNVDVFNVASAIIGITQGVATSGSSTGFTWTGGAHTTLASGTEARDWEWNGARVVQFATTTPATQRQMWMRAATYSCDTAAQTITTAATLAISGAPVAGTNVTITTPLALWVQTGNVSFSESTDNTFTTGYGKLGLVSSGTSTTFYLAQASNYNSTDYALSQNSSGATRINCKTGQTVAVLINGGTKFTVATSSATFPSGVPVTISDSTTSTTTGTGALIVTGGCGIGGQLTASTMTVTGAVTFNSAGSTFTLNHLLLFGNGFAAYDTARTQPTIYGTSSAGAAYPFLEAGNLIISPRISGAARDVIITAAGTSASFRFNRLGNFVMGEAALATNATDGFFYVRTCAGTPTGVPSSFTGTAAMCYDSTNHKLYVYDSGWKTTTVFA